MDSNRDSLLRIVYCFFLVIIAGSVSAVTKTSEHLNCVTHEKNIQDIIMGYLDEYIYMRKHTLTKSRPVKKIMSSGSDLLVLVHDIAQPELHHYKVKDAIRYQNQYTYFAIDTVIDEINQGLVSVYNNPPMVRYDQILDGYQTCSYTLAANHNYGLQLMAQGNYIVVGALNQISVIDARTGTLCNKLTRPRISSFTCSPNNQHIAYGRLDTGVTIWDIVTQQEQVCEREDQKYSAASLAYSPNGKLLIALCRDFFVVWDAKTGKKIGEVTLPRDWQYKQVLFVPHGNSFAIASQVKESSQSKIAFFDATKCKLMQCSSASTTNLKATQIIDSPIAINTMLFLQNGLLCVGCNGYLAIYRSAAYDLQQREVVAPDHKESKTESGCIIC